MYFIDGKESKISLGTKTMWINAALKDKGLCFCRKMAINISPNRPKWKWKACLSIWPDSSVSLHSSDSVEMVLLYVYNGGEKTTDYTGTSVQSLPSCYNSVQVTDVMQTTANKCKGGEFMASAVIELDQYFSQ